MIGAVVLGAIVSLGISPLTSASCVSGTNCGGGGGGGSGCTTDAYWIYVYGSDGEVDLGGTIESNGALYAPCVGAQVSISPSGVSGSYSFQQWLVTGGSVSCSTCSSTTFTAASSATTGSLAMVLHWSPSAGGAWGGYIATGSQISSVSGTFTVPSFSYVGIYPIVDEVGYWVGIGGVGNALWQAGLVETANGLGGTTIDVFYEAVSGSGGSGGSVGPVLFTFAGGISEGAQIIVDLSVSSSTSYYSVGYWNYVNLVWWNGSVSFKPDQSYVEWVGEAPIASDGDQYVLPDVASVTFTNPLVDGSGSYILPLTSITLDDDSSAWSGVTDQYLTPSSISGNSQFTLTYST